MKPFLAAVAASILIAAGAHFALQSLDWSTAEARAGDSVRLD